jgi:hypothetical protein
MPNQCSISVLSDSSVWSREINAGRTNVLSILLGLDQVVLGWKPAGQNRIVQPQSPLDPDPGPGFSSSSFKRKRQGPSTPTIRFAPYCYAEIPS